MASSLEKWLSYSLVSAARLYRRFVSPFFHQLSRLMGLTNAGCRFHPTCSEYFIESITVHGPLKGSGRGVFRVLRCHPFSQGGCDPVKPKQTVMPPRRLESAQASNEEIKNHDG